MSSIDVHTHYTLICTDSCTLIRREGIVTITKQVDGILYCGIAQNFKIAQENLRDNIERGIPAPLPPNYSIVEHSGCDTDFLREQIGRTMLDLSTGRVWSVVALLGGNRLIIRYHQ
jgi:hypothetical protein